MTLFPANNLNEEAYLESLFAQAEAYLRNNPYSNIDEAPSFHHNVRGVTFNNRQEIISNLTVDTPIYLERDPFHPVDPNAILVKTCQGEQIGFLAAQIAIYIAPLMDAGEQYSASITSITGGNQGKNFGVNILVIKDSAYQCSFDPAIRNMLTQLPDKALFNHIRKSILGNVDYHTKQREAILSLLRGENVLGIFGTGRGKSAIFQTLAAFRALREGRITVIVYPLRALSNDQFLSMQGMFSALGLRIYRANGGLSAEEKHMAFQAMATGEIDILLTTPEFLLHHAAKLGGVIDRIGLFVIDECHHIKSDSHRPAYKNLDRVVSLLGNPQVLAVTATANDSTARDIAGMLGITTLIVDSHVRDNLNLVDARGCRDKKSYLMERIGIGKSIVYVGTRDETVRLAKAIRDTIPSLRNAVGFYHGKMTSKDRSLMEEMFRNDTLRVIVATKAFGEGVNIPNVTDVYLYHLMYSFTEFNQMAGRAGRNGKTARVHLLFGEKDTSLNWHIVKSQAPDRDTVSKVYVALRHLPSNATNSSIANYVKSQGAKDCNETTVSVSLGILEELGLIVRETVGNKREITVIMNPQRVDLSYSLRFQEGQEELEEFNRFRMEILNLDQPRLERFIQKPICPRADLLQKRAEQSDWWLMVN